MFLLLMRSLVVAGVSVHMESWICYCFYSNSNMALFDVHHSFFNSLSHLQFLHYDRQSTSTESCNVHFLGLIKPLSSVNKSHFEKFIDNCSRFSNSIGITGFQHYQFGNKFLNLTDNFIIFLIIVSILNMISSDNMHFSNVWFFFPVEEISVF